MDEHTPDFQDCVLCGLPSEIGVEFDVSGEAWLTIVCITGHLVTLPESDYEIVLRNRI